MKGVIYIYGRSYLIYLIIGAQIGEYSTGKTSLIINELESYLLEPRAQENQNILIWWKEREKIFPKLSTMARDLLCIQASSVSIERQFSKAALVLTKKRNRLNPKSLKSLLCLHSFYKIILSSHLFILFLDDVRKKNELQYFQDS